MIVKTVLRLRKALGLCFKVWIYQLARERFTEYIPDKVKWILGCTRWTLDGLLQVPNFAYNKKRLGGYVGTLVDVISRIEIYVGQGVHSFEAFNGYRPVVTRGNSASRTRLIRIQI